MIRAIKGLRCCFVYLRNWYKTTSNVKVQNPDITHWINGKVENKYIYLHTGDKTFFKSSSISMETMRDFDVYSVMLTYSPQNLYLSNVLLKLYKMVIILIITNIYK
jgi:hypothetical protein